MTYVKNDIIKLKTLEDIKLQYDCYCRDDESIVIGGWLINKKMFHMFGWEQTIQYVKQPYSKYDFVIWDLINRRFWSFKYDWIVPFIEIIMDVDDLFKEIDI